MRHTVTLITLLLCTNVSAQTQTQTPTAAEELAAKLVAAATETERESLLTGRPELMAPELRRTLVALGDAHRRRGQAAPALRAAALKSLHGGKHAHPFYWAGFVLVGDGG